MESKDPSPQALEIVTGLKECLGKLSANEAAWIVRELMEWFLLTNLGDFENGYEERPQDSASPPAELEN